MLVRPRLMPSRKGPLERTLIARRFWECCKPTRTAPNLFHNQRLTTIRQRLVLTRTEKRDTPLLHLARTLTYPAARQPRATPLSPRARPPDAGRRLCPPRVSLRQ